MEVEGCGLLIVRIINDSSRKVNLINLNYTESNVRGGTQQHLSDIYPKTVEVVVISRMSSTQGTLTRKALNLTFLCGKIPFGVGTDISFCSEQQIFSGSHWHDATPHLKTNVPSMILRIQQQIQFSPDGTGLFVEIGSITFEETPNWDISDSSIRKLYYQIRFSDETMTESPVKIAIVAKGPMSASTDRQENIKKALNALIQGKRHMLMKDNPHACSALGEACRLFTEVYGPLASEHAESHFFYGKALLDQGRAELAVFEAPAAGAEETKSDEGGEDGEEKEEGEESDNKEESEEKKDDAKAESDEAVKTSETPETAQETTSAEEDLNAPSPVEPEINGKAGSSSATMEVDDEKPSTSKGVSEDTTLDAGDELSSLALAWEVLEIAKLGYSKQVAALEVELQAADVENRGNKEEAVKQLQQRLAETHSLLGEVGTESESYPQAIEDFKTALAMYTQYEKPDSRDLAQVHFHIGVAHGLAKSFQGSIDSFKQSVAIIKTRVEKLKQKLEKVEGVDTSEAVRNEIKELSKLVLELEEKINDTLEQEKESMKLAEEDKMEEEIIQRNSPVKNPNPPAINAISHLVKKRKKVEPTTETEPEPPPAKKKLVRKGDAPSPATNAYSKVESVPDTSE